MCSEELVELYLPSELGYEKVAIAVIKALAQKIGFSTERTEDLKTALGEAVTNAIEHGNQLNVELRVFIALTIQEQSLILSVVDEGRQPIPTIPTEHQERADHRGWGMFLIKSLMDDVETLALPGRNEIRMLAYLNN